MYQYILLKQDGTKEDLGTSKEKPLAEIYKLLLCRTVEIIPPEYYEGFGKCTMWGDEEARFSSRNIRNPHFKVLKDFEGQEWDIVGDILYQLKVRKEK